MTKEERDDLKKIVKEVENLHEELFNRRLDLDNEINCDLNMGKEPDMEFWKSARKLMRDAEEGLWQIYMKFLRIVR